MNGNVLVVHGGGPTAVINSSLYGVIEEAKALDWIRFIRSDGRQPGDLKGRFFDLLQVPEERLKLY